jgi:integrator complex subunit 11
MMNFKSISPFDRKLIKSPEKMVLFATPGMLHAGLSMQVFKEWCHDEKNLLIIPGYCVAGTLGNKLL